MDTCFKYCSSLNTQEIVVRSDNDVRGVRVDKYDGDCTFWVETVTVIWVESAPVQKFSRLTSKVERVIFLTDVSPSKSNLFLSSIELFNVGGSDLWPRPFISDGCWI